MEINLKLTTSFLFLTAFMLLLTGCDQKTQTSDLLTAIDKGQSDIVQELLGSGIDPNKDAGPIAVSELSVPFEGAYPLHLAALKGNKEIVQILLDNGAKIDLRATNKDEATPLAWAAFFGQKDVVSLLIESGAAINVLDANHTTPLDAARYAYGKLSPDDEERAKHLMEIITILKDNGGKHADEL